MIGHPPGSAACAYTIATDAPDTLGISPVPANAIDDARDAARAVLADPTASARLTSAAYCVVEAWRAARGKPSNAHWTVSASQLSVDYVCGTRFRLRNMHPVPISVEWRAGSSSLSRLTLPRPAPGATFSEITIDVNAPGDLALYVDGEPIVSRANRGTSCI